MISASRSTSPTTSRINVGLRVVEPMALRQASCATPDWAACACSRREFVKLVRQRGASLYRDLPWRNIDDAYGVLVSEVMLQQTQVKRVIRYWQRWLELFPSVDALAAADTAVVLDAWQGLGYNRRALALKRACEQCSAQNAGRLPDTVEALVGLPGIGPATAAGVVAFAYDRPAVYIETNVRSVFLHELFPADDEVPDKKLAPYVADTCPETGARAWYYALLDYGAHLKATLPNPSRRSAHYARQGAFEGSRRQKRSFVLKAVLAAGGGIDRGELCAALDAAERDAGREPLDPAEFSAIVSALIEEGFFREDAGLLVP